MNGQIHIRIEELEKELESLKTLVGQKDKKVKKPLKKSALVGLWKGLKITDQEIKQAKKDVFDFDAEKYVT